LGAIKIFTNQIINCAAILSTSFGNKTSGYKLYYKNIVKRNGYMKDKFILFFKKFNLSFRNNISFKTGVEWKNYQVFQVISSKKL